MLALVCVLECLDLTGLELHEWLGFALCPLVLLHVTWQWPWFVSQFRKFPRAPGTRLRINTLLNGLLLVLMSAVLLSGVLNSRHVISLVGERFGSVHVWREMHNWLNFTLLVWVALHLGLNWDWVLGLVKKHHRGRPSGAEPLIRIGAQSRPTDSLFRRGVVVLAAVVLSASVTYCLMDPLLANPKHRPEPRTTSPAQIHASLAQLLPQPRPILLPHGFEQLSVTSGLVLTLVLAGRDVFRLRL
jgi:hypothetical protein